MEQYPFLECASREEGIEYTENFFKSFEILTQVVDYEGTFSWVMSIGF